MVGKTDKRLVEPSVEMMVEPSVAMRVEWLVDSSASLTVAQMVVKMVACWVDLLVA